MSESNPLAQRSIFQLSCHFIQHNKPNNVGCQEPKGFRNASTFGCEKGHIIIYSNFGTLCTFFYLVKINSVLAKREKHLKRHGFMRCMVSSPI